MGRRKPRAHERKRRERKLIKMVRLWAGIRGWLVKHESSFSLVPIVSHVNIEAMVTKVSPTSPNGGT
jgi:hypothetical protein